MLRFILYYIIPISVSVIKHTHAHAHAHTHLLITYDRLVIYYYHAAVQ